MTWQVNHLNWSIQQLINSQQFVNLRPQYQRDLVWDRFTQQRLIWCILKGQDIPKLFFHAQIANPTSWDVVDGKQRIHTILQFSKDKIRLAPQAEPIDEMPVAGLTFSQLPSDLRTQFIRYNLQVTEIDSDDQKRIIDQFLDLQRGRILTGQERRQAPPGFVRDLAKALAEHPFVNFAKINYKRAKKQETLSRLLVWEFNGEIVDTHSEVLDRFYLEHAGDRLEMSQWRAIKPRMFKTLDRLSQVFSDYHAGLRTIVTFMLLYWLWRDLDEQYVVTHKLIQDFPQWFDKFHNHILEQKETEGAPYALQNWAAGSSIVTLNQERYSYLHKMFFFEFRDLVEKDPKRRFSEPQRAKIWQRANGRCQWVDDHGVCGTVLPYAEWEADHQLPHSQGGKTVVGNGRVLCPYRNRGGVGECPHKTG